MRQFKKNIFVLSFFFFLALVFPFHIHTTEPYYTRLLKEDLSPTPELQGLLEVMGLPKDIGYRELLDKTQAEWIRLSKERWEEAERFQDKKELIQYHLNKLGCLEQVNSTKRHYDYAIILGATVAGTRPKLVQLVEELNKGVTFDKIVFLTADWAHDSSREIPAFLNLDQPLLPMKKDWTPPKKMPTTEYEITKELLNQIVLPKGITPQDFYFVAVKDLKDSNGNPRRASTKDTLVEFVNTYDVNNKSCLVFSIQPHIGYQDAVTREILPNTCDIETIGRACSPNMNAAVQLDSVARWIYATGQSKRAH